MALQQHVHALVRIMLLVLGAYFGDVLPSSAFYGWQRLSTLLDQGVRFCSDVYLVQFSVTDCCALASNHAA